MIRIISLLLAILPLVIESKAQIKPENGSCISSRIVGFSFPDEAYSGSYMLEVVKGRVPDDAAFNAAEKIAVINTKDSRVIAELPSFGAVYTWRVTPIAKRNTSEKKGSLYMFKVASLPDEATSFRFRVITKAKSHKNAYVFLDATHTLYNMEGEPVWFVPSDLLTTDEKVISDLKMSPQGTVTFINEGDGVPQEISYDGKLLWTARNIKGVKRGEFHHDFGRLKNGNYMAIRYNASYWLLPGKQDSKSVNGEIIDSSLYQQVPFSTIVEFDSNYKKVWEWREADYFLHSDVHDMIREDSTFDVDPHINAFYMDDRTGHLYLSYKNINRILKVKYPEGYVVNSYGPVYSGSEASLSNKLYCGQHSCKTDEKGHLYLFNNNACSGKSYPKLILMSQPDSGSTELQKQWEFICDAEILPLSELQHINFAKGGNIVTLSDGSVFASLNAPYSLVFIVDKNKKVQWSALPEMGGGEGEKWKVSRLYRASIIDSKADLERFIWSGK